MRIMRRDPERWAILARLLRRGGKFTMVGTNEGRKRMFFAPYTYFAQLPDGTGTYDVVTITGSRVAVRARPSRTAPVLGRLSHRVVRVHWVQGRPVRTGDWYRITMPDGRTGYVPSRYAKSPVDYRAGFVKHEGRWTLYAALAGD